MPTRWGSCCTIIARSRSACTDPRTSLAVRLKPDFADAWFNLGNALQALGRHADAIPSYEQTLRYRPGDAVAHNNLGVALESVGRPDEALGHYQAALRLQPGLREAQLGVERVGTKR